MNFNDELKTGFDDRKYIILEYIVTYYSVVRFIFIVFNINDLSNL